MAAKADVGRRHMVIARASARGKIRLCCFILVSSCVLFSRQGGPEGGGARGPVPWGVPRRDNKKRRRDFPYTATHTSPSMTLHPLEKRGGNAYNGGGAFLCCVGGRVSCIGVEGVGSTLYPAFYYLGVSYCTLLWCELQGGLRTFAGKQRAG